MTQDKKPDEGIKTVTATPPPAFSEPTPATPEPVAVKVEATPAEKPVEKRRIVKLPFNGRPETTTMWLVENGKKRPISNSTKAALLYIPVEVVTAQEIQRWPEGEPY